MNIVVFGAGAIGSLFGGLLSQKNRVVLIGRKPHVHAIKTKGLSIEGKTQLKTAISAYDAVVSLPWSVDLLLLTVKSYDTLLAISQAKELITEKTVVLSLQNGLQNIERIQDVVDHTQIVAGITTHGALFSKPGCISHTGYGTTVIGELDGSETSRVKKIQTVFESAGIATSVSSDIRKDIWSKAIINSCINPVSAFLGCPNGYLLENPILENIIEIICKESTLIAQSCGIQLTYSDMVLKTKEVIEQTAENYSSMLQSISRGKKTEIEAINGALVSLGKAYGIDISVNELLVSLIKTSF